MKPSSLIIIALASTGLAGCGCTERGSPGLVAALLDETEDLDPLRPLPKLMHLACVALAPHVNYTDQAIVRQLQRGDLRALETLYRTYEGVIFSLGRRLCGTDHDAEDVLQETFLEVNRSAKHFRGDGSVVGWVKKICVNKALMRLRQAGRLVEQLIDDEEQPSYPPSLFEVREADSALPDPDMERAFQRLGAVARVVVWLHDVEGYTHEEISSVLGKTVSFSKSQLSRAHARLRDWFNEGDQDSACGT